MSCVGDQPGCCGGCLETPAATLLGSCCETTEVSGVHDPMCSAPTGRVSPASPAAESRQLM